MNAHCSRLSLTRRGPSSTYILYSLFSFTVLAPISQEFPVFSKSIFLTAKCGDLVAICPSRNSVYDWWAGLIISSQGSSVDASVNTLFQVVDIDTGVVKTINADIVRGIIKANK